MCRRMFELETALIQARATMSMVVERPVTRAELVLHAFAVWRKFCYENFSGLWRMTSEVNIVRVQQCMTHKPWISEGRGGSQDNCE